jgi:hypothetical protein
METINEELISRKCANCKSWFAQLPNDQEHYQDYFGVLVRVCDYCAKELGTENLEAISQKELQQLEADTRKFLKLMKQGNFGDARLVAGLLESATYTLDAVWVKGYEARLKRERRR